MIKQNLFSNKITSIILSLFTCLLWGSLFPMIKLGYEAFKIASDDIPTIILFAGLRFVVSGIVLIGISVVKDKKIVLPSKSNCKYILAGALFSIILHYAFAYIALSLGEGSKSAIIKQIGYLFLSCFAFIFDKSDKWSIRKTIAGVLGFAGIIATNSDSSGFSFGIADLLLILASFCSVFGAVASKKATKEMNAVRFVSYSQLLGGVVLLTAGIFMGGKITHITPEAILVFAYICAASVSSYVLWNVLLKYNSLSKLSIIKFSEPLFAVILSGMILGENVLRLSYLIALILILTAIILENYKSANEFKKGCQR